MTDAGNSKLSVLHWAWAFYLALAVAGVVWLGLRRGEIELALFIDQERWPADLALGLAVGGALSGAWEVARRLLPSARLVEHHFAEILGPVTASEAVALAVLSAIAEEFFFRGAVQDAWGFVPAAVLFTLLHLGPGRELRLWTLFAALAGLALGGLVVWRQTLMAPTVAHALVNGIGLSRLAIEARKGSDG